MRLRNITLAVLVSATAASAQFSPFLMRYSANTDPESYISIVNISSIDAPLLGPGFGPPAGNVCINVYAFDPYEEMVACCSCLATPDQVVTLGLNTDLLAHPVTGGVPTSVTIKLVSTLAGGDGTGTNCTNSAATVMGATMAAGAVAAWGTTLHVNSPPESEMVTYATTESQFLSVTGSSSELASVGGRCASIIGNNSGYGVCNSCQAGALGATRH